MLNPYEAMREKLTRFNAWEAEVLRLTGPGLRLDRFLLLHDLGMSYERRVIEKRREEHLQALIACGKRLKQASLRRNKESA